MPWNTLTTYSAGEAVTSAEWNNLVENMSYLKAGRTRLAYDYGTASWSISAGAGTFQNDSGSAAFQLSITLADTGNILAMAVIRWESDTVRNLSTKFRFACDNGSSVVYGDDMDYISCNDVNNYRQYVCIGWFEDKAAATYTIYLQGARNTGTDTVNVENRTIAALSSSEVS